MKYSNEYVRTVAEEKAFNKAEREAKQKAEAGKKKAQTTFAKLRSKRKKKK